MENWKAVKGFEGLYMVSSLGNVKSLNRYETTKAGWSRKRVGRVLKKSYGNGQGKYEGVSLGANNYRLVHRLVAETFIENKHNYPHVNHKDKNTKNNCVDNLEWVTPHLNMVHASGVQFSLTNGECIEHFKCIKDAAFFLACNTGNVSRLVNKKKYNHIKGWRLLNG